MTGLIDPDRLDHVRRIASSMIGPTT
jgi:hypothetical protein